MNTDLDLHGVKHVDVPRKLDNFLSLHLQNKTNEINIIIGNSKEMKKIVDFVLDDYGLVSEVSFLNDAILNIKL